MRRIVPTPRHKIWLVRLCIAVAIAIAVVGGGRVAFQWGQQIANERLHNRAQESVRMRALALQGMLATQRAVVKILSRDETIRRALVDPAYLPAASQKLEDLLAASGGASIYLIGADGLAKAASNWRNDESFIGVDYTFRDYFQDALHHDQGYQFTTGHTTRRAGLHLSNAVHATDDPADPVTGVIVSKIEFDDLARAWAQSGDLTWVSDAGGDTVIVSNAGDNTRQGIVASVPIQGLDDWVMYVRLPLTAGRHTAYLVLGAYLWACSLVALAFWAWRAHQARLNRRSAAKAEARLDELRRDLQQASRLSTLGQITSGVAHEINQPLAAMRLLAENAATPARAPSPELTRDLGMVLRMIDRITQITDNLRRFARKTDTALGPVPLKQAIDNSLLLTSGLPQAKRVTVTVHEFDHTITVSAEPVPLEQILVNLIHNAYDAAPDIGGKVDIAVTTDGDRVQVTLRDNGNGIPPALADRLFEPFVTSKDNGLGLGLVISREIARKFGGELHLENNDGTVARLVLVKA